MSKKSTKTKQPNNLPIILGIGFLCVLVVSSLFQAKKNAKTEFMEPANSQAINPEEFSTEITNKYLSLPVGTTFVYESQTDEGLERVEIEITGETKNVMGVETLVYRDKVWVDNVIHEDTRDYMAQHRNGDVWYFGEDVDNYSKGKLIHHGGSWHAGENGALPGIVVKANPKVGDSYQQEYYPGEAEDMVDVLSLDETVTVPYGTFTNCLKTFDWSPLDPSSLENKYYCPEARTVVLEVDTTNGEKKELIDVITTSGTSETQ